MTAQGSVQVTTLDNGLRIVSDAMSTVETVSVGAWVGVGTRDEPAEINGISHLLEHMAFKGTKTRDAYAIAAEIEAVGGHLNAYTSREHTAYFAKLLKGDLPLAVDLLSDILQHSVMDSEELDRERDVIVQEIHQAHDTPDDIVFDHFQTAAYPDQAMGRPILGSAPLVKGIEREVLMAYMADYYNAPRTILSAAGNVDHDHFVEFCRTAFDALPAHHDAVRESATYLGGSYLESRELEQVHLLIGNEGIAYTDPDYHSASALSTLFGGGMSSRLFQEVREKRGLAYAVYSYLSCYSDGGLFGIYAGTGEKEVEHLVPLIDEEIDKLRRSVDDEEVARARAQMRAGLLMSQESTTSQCEQLARQMAVFGRPIPIRETLDKIDAVTAESVIRTAGRLFDGPRTVAVVGPALPQHTVDRLSLSTVQAGAA